jgi:hypothetical protein
VREGAITIPSFATVTFSLRWESAFEPLIERPLHLSVEHYPETNVDDIQLGGVSQGRVTLPVWLSSAADLATLRAAMAAGTIGTLAGLWDGDHADMLLVGISGLGGTYGDPRVRADLEFLETTDSTVMED